MMPLKTLIADTQTPHRNVWTHSCAQVSTKSPTSTPPIGVYKTNDATPFGMSLSKPFDRLIPNGYVYMS